VHGKGANMSFSIKQSMSAHPMTVRSKDDLSAAYIRMKRECYRHMPVIDDKGNLVGMISDRDFKRAMWPMNAADAHGLPEESSFRKESKVADYMSWPVIALSEDTSLLLAVQTMIDQKVSALVVMRDGDMTGILTNEDLLKVLASLLKRQDSLSEMAVAIAYNSPLSKVSELLATAGI
jgi:acetoin utilization protein AcuB